MAAVRKYQWKVQWAEWGSDKLTRLLHNGWEPFGASASHVWLRKRSLVRDV